MSCISYELIAQVVENTAFAKGYRKRELILKPFQNQIDIFKYVV